jgi:hypothetical protein
MVDGPPEDVNPLVNMEENIPCIAHSSMALQPVWEEFSIGRSDARMQLPCDGESEGKSGQDDNEVAAANLDLDSIDGDGTAPKKEKDFRAGKNNPSLFVL